MKMSAQNPLSGIQSVQQIPGGIPPAVAQYFQDLQAQQQQAPSQNLDHSQLGDYIKQLQENGASDSQIQQVIQKLQDNGGQMPQQTDTMQGGSGTDAISNGEHQNGGNLQSSAPVVSGGSDQSAQSPLSQNLNALAGGQGNVNYDVLGGSYPTPRPIPQLSQQDLLLQQLARPNTGGAGGGLAIAVQGAKAADIQQQIAQIAALNNRDVAAYQELMKAAQESGKTQDSQSKTEMIGQSNADKNDTALARIDAATSKAQMQNVIAQQNADSLQAKRENDAAKVKQQAAVQAILTNNAITDATGDTIHGKVNKDNLPTSPVVMTDLQRAVQLRTDAGMTPAGALADIRSHGVDLSRSNMIKEQTPDTTFGIPTGTKDTDYMTYPPSTLATLRNLTGTPRTAPNVATATPIGVPAISSTPVEAIQNGGSVSTPSDGAGISLARPKTKADLDALPSGTKYVNPVNHSVYIKP